MHHTVPVLWSFGLHLSHPRTLPLRTRSVCISEQQPCLPLTPLDRGSKVVLLLLCWSIAPGLTSLRIYAYYELAASVAIVPVRRLLHPSSPALLAVPFFALPFVLLLAGTLPRVYTTIHTVEDAILSAAVKARAIAVSFGTHVLAPAVRCTPGDTRARRRVSNTSNRRRRRHMYAPSKARSKEPID